MVAEKTNEVRVVINNYEPHFMREIELKNIGFLKREPTHIHCVACQYEGLSAVQLEQVTCLQRFVGVTKLCKSWRGLNDINHYCSKCGCYIGRFLDVGCSERCVSECARRKAANGEIRLRTKTKNYSELIADYFEERKAKKRAAKAAEIQKEKARGGAKK